MEFIAKLSSILVILLFGLWMFRICVDGGPVSNSGLIWRTAYAMFIAVMMILAMGGVATYDPSY